MKYRIALHQSDEGYSVSVPGMPGCWSQGATEGEAIDNIKSAIKEYLFVADKFKGGKIELIETKEGILIRPIKSDPVKESKGLLKGTIFTTAKYLQQKKQDKELE